MRILQKPAKFVVKFTKMSKEAEFGLFERGSDEQLPQFEPPTAVGDDIEDDEPVWVSPADPSGDDDDPTDLSDSDDPEEWGERTTPAGKFMASSLAMVLRQLPPLIAGKVHGVNPGAVLDQLPNFTKDEMNGLEVAASRWLAQFDVEQLSPAQQLMAACGIMVIPATMTALEEAGKLKRREEARQEIERRKMSAVSPSERAAAVKEIIKDVIPERRQFQYHSGTGCYRLEWDAERKAYVYVGAKAAIEKIPNHVREAYDNAKAAGGSDSDCNTAAYKALYGTEPK